VNVPQKVTTPIIPISPETWKEVRAVEERRKLQEERQRAADIANDQRTEARTRQPRRTNIHDL
jgi:hypothetical protein